MERCNDKKKHAERLSLASLLIGGCIIPVWFLLLWALSYTNIDMKLVFLVLPVVVTLIGMVLGVIGLLKSMHRESHTTKGIVLSSLGILLNVLVLCAAMLIWIVVDAVSQPLI